VIFPDGLITGNFSDLTQQAVSRFQEKYADEILKPAGLTNGNGRVGPGTRKKLNDVCIISPAETIPFIIKITVPEDPMLQKTSELLKEQWAKSWDEVSENIKAEKGKVSNKQQIENILIINTRGVANEQILYETQFNKYKIRISAINDILTAVVQRISELKQQVEQSKIIKY